MRAERTGVELDMATVMSTHFHLQVYRRLVNDVIWEPGDLSIVELVTGEV